MEIPMPFSGVEDPLGAAAAAAATAAAPEAAAAAEAAVEAQNRPNCVAHRVDDNGPPRVRACWRWLDQHFGIG